MPNLTALIIQSLETQEKYLKTIENQLFTMPAGSLYQVKNLKNRYFFHNVYEDGKPIKTYLGTQHGKQAQLISDLKRKRFLLACKKVLEGNVVALRACVVKYKEFDPALLSSRLAATYESVSDATAQLDCLDWQHAPYPRAEMYQEGLKHEAIGGLMVRSKSEALIAFALDLAHIPFHYEEILELESKKITPDFTILHPATGERIYWEHFGMMDDSEYATETFKKLIAYGQNGFMPGKNLLFTMENNAEPLSIREIQGIIKHYLLN